MAVSYRPASGRREPGTVQSAVGAEKKLYYGGPNPRFTKAYGWFLLCNCLYLFAAPLTVAGILLRETDQSVHSNVVFFGRLYGLTGAVLCMQLLAKPILTKMQSLLTGLTACAFSLVLMRNRQTMIKEMHLFWTMFFSFVGVYFIIRSPNARKSFNLRSADHCE